MYTLHEIKDKLILTVLDIEKQRIGARRCVIPFDSAEYYQSFEEFYLSNEDRFAQALVDLCDLSDEVYERKRLEISNLYSFCPERVAVHILRLSVYFGVQLEIIPALLKGLFFRAFELRKKKDYRNTDTGNLLDQSCTKLLKEIANNPELYADQPHFRNKEIVRAGLKNFVSLDEVTDIASAYLYDDCARYKLVPKCPAYIKQAEKAAFLYDRLVGPVAWELFLGGRSSEKVRRNVSALRIVGFERIPDLLEELLAIIESRERSPKERKQISAHLQKKYRKRIEEVVCAEENTVDNFLLCQID